MKKADLISKIMTKNVVTLHKNDSLHDAEKLFKKYHIRHLPVVDHNKIIGILSLTDLMRMSFCDSYGDSENIDENIFDMLSVGEIMAAKPVSVSQDMNIRDVAALLATKEFHALPVVDKDKLVGIITTTDLLKYLVSRC